MVDQSTFIGAILFSVLSLCIIVLLSRINAKTLKRHALRDGLTFEERREIIDRAATTMRIVNVALLIPMAIVWIDLWLQFTK